jgi:HD-GYP domain-containing protein (c-di-GMP phosphodiesterase class II)
LRTNRPYRGAWSSEKALKLIEDETGDDFDHQFSGPFVQMMQEQAIQRVQFDNPVVGEM